MSQIIPPTKMSEVRWHEFKTSTQRIFKNNNPDYRISAVVLRPIGILAYKTLVATIEAAQNVRQDDMKSILSVKHSIEGVRNAIGDEEIADDLIAAGNDAVASFKKSDAQAKRERVSGQRSGGGLRAEAKAGIWVHVSRVKKVMKWSVCDCMASKETPVFFAGVMQRIIEYILYESVTNLQTTKRITLSPADFEAVRRNPTIVVFEEAIANSQNA